MSSLFHGRHFEFLLLYTIVLHNRPFHCISFRQQNVESFQCNTTKIKYTINFSYTCNKHLIRSPGAMITVVNTPDNIPAANNCGKLNYTLICTILNISIN